jgi:Holliday junction resolvase RusA-like endonuclease
MQRKVILNITPQTHVRATQGDRVFFRIPRDKLFPSGLKRLKRLEKYNEYKISLLALAKAQRFLPTEQGHHITFYIPVSKSWTKAKKAKYHLQLHQEQPDIDNLTKSFFDSLLPEDKHIADVRITKKWVNQEKGWIEILIDPPSIPSSDNLM